MAVPAWFWPASGAQARGISLVPFGPGLVVADWTQPVLWPFANNAIGVGITLKPAIAVSGTPATVAMLDSAGNPMFDSAGNAMNSADAETTFSANNQGFAGAAADAASGVWAVTWDGTFWHQPYSNVPVSGALPSENAYIGAAFAGGSGFAVAASGQVYTAASVLLGSFPLPVRSVVASGSTIAGCMATSGVGLMNASNGATGFIALPSGMTTLSCAAVSSGHSLAVGGWCAAAPLGGMAAAALDPQDPLLMLAVGSGSAVLWSAPGAYADAWAQTQAVTGLANLNAIGWRPDGTQALATSLTSGAVQVLTFTAGSVSLTQTLTVPGACSVAVASNSTNALVAQSGMAQAATLSYAGGVWSDGLPITQLPGIVAVAPYGSGAVVAMSGTVQYLNLIAGAWSYGASVGLPFHPTALTVDTHGQIYVAGSGAVAMVSGSTLLASGTWSGGAPTSIAVQQGRIAIAVPGDGLLRVFGLSAPSVLSQQSQTPIAFYAPMLDSSGNTMHDSAGNIMYAEGTGVSLGSQVGLGLSMTTLFAMGSGATLTYGFSGSPYVLTPVLSGSAAFWNGSAWSAAGLGVGHLPSAIGLDASGNAWLTTVQNTLWNLTSGAAVLSSGIVTQYSGQAQTTPICPSSVQVTSSGTFVATSIPGVLTQVA